MTSRKKAISAPYYSIGQLRLDKWNELKNESEELTHCRTGSDNEKKHKEKIELLLNDLSKVEQYFALPGKAIIDRLTKSLAHGEHAVLANVINKTTRLLLNDIYSGNPFFPKEDDGEPLETEFVNNTQLSTRKNYF